MRTVLRQDENRRSGTGAPYSAALGVASAPRDAADPPLDDRPPRHSNPSRSSRPSDINRRPPREPQAHRSARQGVPAVRLAFVAGDLPPRRVRRRSTLPGLDAPAGQRARLLQRLGENPRPGVDSRCRLTVASACRCGASVAGGVRVQPALQRPRSPRGQRARMDGRPRYDCGVAAMDDPAYKQLFSRPRMVEDLLHGFAARDWSGALDFASLARSAAGQLCQPRSAAAPRRPGVACALPRPAVAVLGAAPGVPVHRGPRDGGADARVYDPAVSEADRRGGAARARCAAAGATDRHLQRPTAMERGGGRI